MKKKKLLIVIILAVVLLIAGALAFLILTGRLFGKKDEATSGTDSSAVSGSLSASAASGVSSVAASGASSPTAASGATSVVASGAASTEMAPVAQNDPTKFFEGEYYFQNLTGVSLVEISLSPTGENAWEDDILAGTPLPNGKIWAQPLMLRDLGGQWDLRTTDESGKELLYTGLDFGGNTKFLLTVDGETAVLRQAT